MKSLLKTVVICLLFLSVFISCDKNTVLPRSHSYFTYFDTVCNVYSYAKESEKSFEKNCESVTGILDRYNKLFDIYHEYSGINNLCTVNKNAGKEVEVDKEIIDFLCYAKDCYYLTSGEMNIMLGSVTKLWHECRTASLEDPEHARIPSKENLEKASKHIDIESLVIDKEKNTVTITDEDSQIDVGAVAKGYATEKAALCLLEKGLSGYVLNIGGNIRLIGTKADDKGWKTAIRNPNTNSDSYAKVLYLSDTSCVTSGIYERFFTFEGENYHHIIDKDTFMPSTYFSSVSVVTKDSSYADVLSTALFCMPIEDGLKLANQRKDFEVLWITKDNKQYYTEGLSAYFEKGDDI